MERRSRSMKHYLVRELYTAIPAQDLPEVKVNGWVLNLQNADLGTK